MVGGGHPLPRENMAELTHPLKMPISNQYLLTVVARQPWHLAKKSSTIFPMSLRWSVYVASKPPNAALKRKVAIFLPNFEQ